ncbi:MAG: hypothetical protein ABSB81_01385 [Halobacteriota archaeon]
MAVSLPAFFRSRQGVIGTIVIAIILILAIFAATWTYYPQLYVGFGIRHDPVLDGYVSSLHSVATEQHPTNLTVWSVTWLNDTAVRVNWAFTYLAPGNQTSNLSRTALYKESFVMTDFYGTNFASGYVGSINSNYTLTNITYDGGAYQRAFAHAPSTFAVYQDNLGQGNFIWQFDQFVQVGSLTRSFCT